MIETTTTSKHTDNSPNMEDIQRKSHVKLEFDSNIDQVSLQFQPSHASVTTNEYFYRIQRKD